jgi:hypothetical protein
MLKLPGLGAAVVVGSTSGVSPTIPITKITNYFNSIQTCDNIRFK